MDCSQAASCLDAADTRHTHWSVIFPPPAERIAFLSIGYLVEDQFKSQIRLRCG